MADIIKEISKNKKPIQSREQLEEVLITIFDEIGEVIGKHEYRIVGTAAALLQNVEISTNDVDILFKEREGIDEVHQILSKFNCLKEPEFLGNEEVGGQYLAIYEIGEITVELSTVEYEAETDGMECFGKGPWKHYETIKIENYEIPVIRLELRLISEVYRKREERVDQLIKHLRDKKCNLSLIRRGLSERKISEETQKNIIAKIKG